MLYLFAGHGLETWKKDLTYLSITGPVISGMVFVIRGGELGRTHMGYKSIRHTCQKIGGVRVV